MRTKLSQFIGDSAELFPPFQLVVSWGLLEGKLAAEISALAEGLEHA